jgi:hypothetical protein
MNTTEQMMNEPMKKISVRHGMGSFYLIRVPGG